MLQLFFSFFPLVGKFYKCSLVTLFIYSIYFHEIIKLEETVNFKFRYMVEVKVDQQTIWGNCCLSNVVSLMVNITLITMILRHVPFHVDSSTLMVWMDGAFIRNFGGSVWSLHRRALSS